MSANATSGDDGPPSGADQAPEPEPSERPARTSALPLPIHRESLAADEGELIVRELTGDELDRTLLASLDEEVADAFEATDPIIEYYELADDGEDFEDLIERWGWSSAPPASCAPPSGPHEAALARLERASDDALEELERLDEAANAPSVAAEPPVADGPTERMAPEELMEGEGPTERPHGEGPTERPDDEGPTVRLDGEGLVARLDGATERLDREGATERLEACDLPKPVQKPPPPDGPRPDDPPSVRSLALASLRPHELARARAGRSENDIVLEQPDPAWEPSARRSAADVGLPASVVPEPERAPAPRPRRVRRRGAPEPPAPLPIAQVPRQRSSRTDSARVPVEDAPRTSPVLTHLVAFLLGALATFVLKDLSEPSAPPALQSQDHEPGTEPSAPTPRDRPAVDNPAGEGAGGAPPFDAASARAVLGGLAASAAGCGDGSVTGTALVRVTFARSGRVASAEIQGGPIKGTPVGRCVIDIMRTAEVPPYSGAVVTVPRSVTIR